MTALRLGNRARAVGHRTRDRTRWIAGWTRHYFRWSVNLILSVVQRVWHRLRWIAGWTRHWFVWTAGWTRHWIMWALRWCRHWLRLVWRKCANRIIRITRLGRRVSLVQPRLGRLVHHDPRPLRIPRRYHAGLLPADAPLISIVTPSYNQADMLDRTIASVVDQGYPRLEYIVQDGESSDGSVDVLRGRDADVAYWESTPDDGQTDAINRGFRRSTGEIMAYLNSDDLLLPGSLAYVARVFAEQPEVDVVYGHRVLIDESDREIGRWVLPAHHDRILSWADFVPQETLFWRRRIWDRVDGALDESFHFAMDWDLLVRFREAGAQFRRLPRFLGAFRVHPQQKTSAAIADLGRSEMTRIRQRCTGFDPSPLEIGAEVGPYLMRHLALHYLYRAGIMRY